MEGLKEIVAASFARHGIVCPADPQLVWGRAPSLVMAERNSAEAYHPGIPGSAIVPTLGPAAPTVLPEHNFRKSSQDSCG